LNEHGIATFTPSKGWHEGYVTRILRNRAVLGICQPYHRNSEGLRVPDGAEIPNYFPAIISVDQFEAVRAARSLRKIAGAGRKGKEYNNLFSGLAACAFCLGPMRFVNKGQHPKGGRYLRCTNATRGGLKCSNRSWRYDDFERSFLLFIKYLDLKSLMQASATRERLHVAREELAMLEQRRRDTLNILNVLTGEITGTISSTFVEKINQLNTDLISIEDGRERLNREIVIENRRSTSVDEAELLKLIHQVQDTSTQSIETIRAAIAQRIRGLVDYMTISVLPDEMDKLTRVLVVKLVDGRTIRLSFGEDAHKPRSAFVISRAL
jgi:hypothetical protein